MLRGGGSERVGYSWLEHGGDGSEVRGRLGMGGVALILMVKVRRKRDRNLNLTIQCSKLETPQKCANHFGMPRYGQLADCQGSSLTKLTTPLPAKILPVDRTTRAL